MMKRLTALFLLLFLLLTGIAVRAEELPDTIEYRGGVVLRVIPKDDPNAALINVAYVRCDEPYVIVGQPVEYTIVLSGGVAPYDVDVSVWYQELSDTSLSFWGYGDPTVRADYTFTQTFGKHARFFFQVEVEDAKGQRVVFQTRPFETYPDGSETNATTVAGKVNQVVSEVIKPGMSDYAKAKALHDWLIFNANYDYTFTYYGADGVLLHGAGVCDSYARAYQKLLTAVGIESVIVTGTAGGGAHGWNLVKIDGQWYHVDCTWDDPNAGGAENWNYFMLTDEEMRRDHAWNEENSDTPNDPVGVIVPETDTESQQSERQWDYDVEVSTIEEVEAYFQQHIRPMRKTSYVVIYDGDGTYGDFWKELEEWVDVKTQELVFTEGYPTHMTSYPIGYEICFHWYEEGVPYLRINTERVTGYAGEVIPLVIADQSDEMAGVTWATSNAAVATVKDGVITCVGEGEAVITAEYNGTVLDSVTVTVQPVHAPEFNLTLTGTTLTWNSIPGVTEYAVVRTVNGTATELALTEATTYTLTSAQAPAQEACELSVIGRRVVGGKTVFTYTSNTVAYGASISYSLRIHAGVKTIGDRAFANTPVGNTYLPDGLVSLGAGAFSGCTGVKAVRVPASVTSIGAGAFEGTSLQYAVVKEGSAAHTWFKNNMPNVTVIFE